MVQLAIEPIDAGIADPKDYGAKPLIFFDIDGVFNRIPFAEVYSGPDCGCPPEGHCSHRSDPANWEVRRIDLSEDLYDDVPATLEEGIRIHADWQFPVWISDELAEELRLLYRSKRADIIFLSMWEANSKFLNGYLGTAIPHLKLTRKITESERSVKHRNLFAFLAEIHRHRGSVPPFIWVDDVVTQAEYGVPIESEVRRGLKALHVQHMPPMLILNTATAEGIRRSHWKQILEFVGSHSEEPPVDQR